MRKRGLAALLALLLLTGCGGTEIKEETPTAETVEYSNLSGEESRAQVEELLSEAGIGAERQAQFFRHVDQINAILEPEERMDAFGRGSVKEPLYDPYALVERWDAAYPDFLGYNCRITAYSLFGDFVEIPAEAECRTDMLDFDLAALSADDSAFPGQERAFSALYSTVPTVDSRDPAVHAKTWLEDWQARGIRFTQDPKVRLISVVFHQKGTEGDYLFIGHAGLLFPRPDGELWLLEKLAFQEPYQCVKFPDRAALRDYLMGKYDLDEDQPLAPPFILENDALLETGEKNG